LTDPAPQNEAVQTALERLLAWPDIARSPQLGRFLAYIVQRTLDGNEQAIKAYSIAVDVFGRPADFDPQADPIVRVQARRLRALLDEYYAGPGLGDLIQIHLPVGRYIPEFTAMPEGGEPSVEPAAPVTPRRQGRRLRPDTSWVIRGAVLLGLAVAVYAGYAWWSTLPGAVGAVQRPRVAVVEFQDLVPTDGTSAPVAGLAIELVTDLEQFGNIDTRYGAYGGSSGGEGGGVPASDYVLTGIARSDGDVVQYSAILTEARTRDVVWNHTLVVTLGETTHPDVLDTVARSISLVLGSPRGPLHAAARQYLASATPVAAETNPYLCRVLFDLYRESGAVGAAERANTCFTALPEVEGGDAEVLAAEAILLAEQPGAVEGTGSAIDRQRVAAADLQHALELDPLSGFIWEQQARLHEAVGDLAQARADYSSSVQLNPASVDALAAYARLLAFGGDLAAAEAMAVEAVEGSPNPPAWYEGVPALLALRDGDFADATARAERYAAADSELGPILAIMAAQGSGDSAVVSRYLPQVLGVAAFRAQGILPRLRERISDLALIDAIRAALVRAGVPTAALIRAF
jgi:tetratricopeptide (TPR) repeat protein/TolB-like protein